MQILNTVHSNFFLKKCWLLLFVPGAMLNKLYGWVYFPILWMKKQILWKVKFTWANGLRLSHTNIIYLNYNSMFSALRFSWFPPPPPQFYHEIENQRVLPSHKAGIWTLFYPDSRSSLFSTLLEYTWDCGIWEELMYVNNAFSLVLFCFVKI